MDVRLFHPQDAEQIAQLFHDTVRQINIRDYSDTQVRAWVPDDIHQSPSPGRAAAPTGAQ